MSAIGLQPLPAALHRGAALSLRGWVASIADMLRRRTEWKALTRTDHDRTGELRLPDYAITARMRSMTFNLNASSVRFHAFTSLWLAAANHHRILRRHARG
jgi:hypothetical protein